MCRDLSEAKQGNQFIVAARFSLGRCTGPTEARPVSIPDSPEALGLVPGSRALLAVGHDTRGLVFALLDLADRAQNGAPLPPAKPLIEKPHNRTRSWTRLFTSDVEDKPWYNDREMWPQYLTMLASNR